MRIAYGGILHETNTFSTLATRYDDFGVVRGQDLLDSPVWQEAAAAGHDLFPLFVAHATPGGRVTRECFQRFLDEMLDGLQACLPLDGLLLQLHGAMEVEEIGDGESALLRAIREQVGPETFISITLDLHANLAPEVVARSDLLTAYRTAPHRDVQETQERGARLMLECLQNGIRPYTHLVKLPLLVAGEAAVTEVEPSRSLFARLPILDRLPGVLASSILIGCAWTDSPHTSVSVVITGSDEGVARRVASGLGQEVWAARSRFEIDVPTASIDESIHLAQASSARPVFVSDSGDNPTAGAAGDSPLYLEHLVSSGAEGALVAGICDPQAVRQCFVAGTGRTIDLEIGGKLDRSFAPYHTRVKVERLVPEVDGIPSRALVRIRDVEVVLQSSRRPFTRLNDFQTMGIDIRQKTVVVVKLGYLFPELRDFALDHIMALSPGFGDQRLDRLSFHHLRRPIYPLDPGAAWSGESER